MRSEATKTASRSGARSSSSRIARSPLDARVVAARRRAARRTRRRARRRYPSRRPMPPGVSIGPVIVAMRGAPSRAGARPCRAHPSTLVGRDVPDLALVPERHAAGDRPGHPPRTNSARNPSRPRCDETSRAPSTWPAMMNSVARRCSASVRPSAAPAACRARRAPRRPRAGAPRSSGPRTAAPAAR